MSDVAAEITRLIHGVYESFAAHQSGEIDSVMHDDATVWDVFTPQLIRGRAERDRFHAADQAQMQARGPLSWELETPLIDHWGDTAIARYYLDFAYAPPNATSGRVRITDVLRRCDGKWKIVHHHEGLTPSGVPPITDKTR